MKAILDDAGLRYLELEFLMDWFFDDRATSAAEPPTELRGLLFEAAAALDAHHVKVGNIPGTPCELDAAHRAFAELCADAAQHTDAMIVYEFMPFDVNVNTLDAALAVVDGAGARQRRPRDRHLAYVQARDRARRAAARSRPSTSAGSS